MTSTSLLKIWPQPETLPPAIFPDFNPVTAYASIDVNTGSRQDAGTVTLSVNTGSGYTTVASTNYSAGASKANNRIPLARDITVRNT